ncbi:MAG: hypothetical protein PVSMB7_26700 [Chloroflexota bacterium]
MALAFIASDLNPRLGGVHLLNGAQWHVVRPAVPYPLAIDTRRSSHLLAGAWGQVYESWNAGDSWRRAGRLPPGLVVRSVAIDSSDPRRFVVAVHNSVYVSDDAGRHWTRTASELPGAMNMFILQSPRSPDTWYLGPSVLWKSTNRARTWFRDGSGSVFAPDGIQALSVAPNGDLYTAIWNGGVAVSGDGGATWRRMTAGLNKKTMDVSTTDRRLWAATDGGIYSSADGGLHWTRRGPHTHFRATRVLDRGRYVLAGGSGGIFRSDDGGQHWRASTYGLPFYLYVYKLVADPSNPHRVYACLNADGIFRSDDDGRSWSPVNSGIPLTGAERASRSVLFRQNGVLWITGASGADPQNLTVDNQVQTAVTSPDGASAAYVTGSTDGWAVRVVNAGGSAARTVVAGTGVLPTDLYWAPNSAALVVPAARVVVEIDWRAGTHSWPAPPAERMLGWSANGTNLLFWDGVRSQALVRDPRTGRVISTLPGSYPSEPRVAPDARHFAFVHARSLYVGTWGQATRDRLNYRVSCTLGAWSDDSSRVLTVCDGMTQERGTSGSVRAQAKLPAPPFWAPGSQSTLLYVYHGLWRWWPGGGSGLVVPRAESVQPRSAIPITVSSPG